MLKAYLTTDKGRERLVKCLTDIHVKSLYKNRQGLREAGQTSIYLQQTEEQAAECTVGSLC